MGRPEDPKVVRPELNTLGSPIGLKLKMAKILKIWENVMDLAQYLLK
jgi:hypothetical protein